MSEQERKFYILLIIFFFLLAWAKSAYGVCVQFKNIDPVLKEIAMHDMKRMSKNIVDLYECPIDTNGGVLVDYSPWEWEHIGTTNKSSTENIKGEKIFIQTIIINKRQVERYLEVNRIYAFKNGLYHEMFCHALVDNADHTDYGLCRSLISTDKAYWGKQHRIDLKNKLDINFKE